MSKRKMERAFDKRQAEWRATITHLKSQSGMKAPRGGWETAYRQPGSRSQKHVRG